MLWKICKVTDVSTAWLCAELQANMIGLHAIFRLTEEQVLTYSQIVNQFRSSNAVLRPVLVTKIEDINDLVRMVGEIGINIVQLHRVSNSKELGRFHQGVLDRMGISLRFICVISAEDSAAVSIIKSLRHADQHIEYYLVDASWRGGTGRLADKARVTKILNQLPAERTLLAGGINPENIRDVLTQFNVAGVDVQSGVELKHSNHSKDPILLQKMATLVKGYSLKNYQMGLRRRLVSVSFSTVQQSEVTHILTRFQQTDIDVIHYDYSDGTILRGSLINPIALIAQQAITTPCLPYDLHLFSRKSITELKSVINRYLDMNPLLRVAFLHCEVPADGPHMRVTSWGEETQDLGVGAGLAVHCTTWSSHDLNGLLPQLADSGIIELLFVTHSSRHSLDHIRRADVPIVQIAWDFNQREKQFNHIALDRDMTYSKLARFSKVSDHVISGRFLLDVPSPRNRIAKLRSLLEWPVETV